MKCPRDRKTLVQDSIRGIPVDKCLECQGIWFDGGELEHIVRTYKIESAELGKVVSDIPETFAKLSPNLLTWVCPQDGARLERIAYANDRGTAIEHCNLCQGWWFDYDDVNRALALHVPNPITERVATMMLKEEIRQIHENKKELERLHGIIGDLAHITSPYGLIYFISKILMYIVKENINDKNTQRPKRSDFKPISQ